MALMRREPVGVTRFLLLLVLFGSACGGDASETYGFVATLGDDTTSIERITRAGNRVESDAIGRSPVLVRRRWQATLADDGTVRDWSMHTHFANAPAGEADLYHTAVFGDSAVRIVRRTSRDSTDRTFRQQYAVMVPWNAFLYGTWELLLAAARGRADTTRVGIYFFEGWAEGGFGFGRVRALGGDSLSVSSTGLSGAGVAHVDSAGRLLAYSGEGTTYKQQVHRVDDVPDLDAIFDRFAADESGRGPTTSLSVRDTARGSVGGVDATIDYSRPLARGRALVGGLIPYGRVWRTGANAATHVTFSAPVELAGVPLEAGTYTLWTLPTEGGVQLIINRQTGQWGTGYGQQHDIARVPMRVETTAAPVEAFTIRIEPAGEGEAAGALVMEWGTFRWSVPVRGR
jgi:hypothetical protein